MNMGVDIFTSYFCLTMALAGKTNKVVMVPESYEEDPLKDQGKLVTEAIINER